MKEFFIKINDKLSDIMAPYLAKGLAFLLKEYYIVYASIAILVAILLLAGLFTCLKRFPKLFLLLIFLLGAVNAVWYFFVLKK